VAPPTESPTESALVGLSAFDVSQVIRRVAGLPIKVGFLGLALEAAYTGPIDERGRPNGHGRAVLGNGVFQGWAYDGAFDAGCLTGQATLTQCDGTVDYVGGWRFGRCWSEGIHCDGLKLDISSRADTPSTI
jgi:hypothetical protein